MHSTLKIFDTVTSVFMWYCKKHSQLDKKYFLNLKLIKECSGYHFHYFLILEIDISMKNIDEIDFCPHTVELFFRLTERDKKTFNFIYPFRSVYCRVNQTVLTVYCDCQDLDVENCNSQVSCFQRYFPKKGSYLGLEEFNQ